MGLAPAPLKLGTSMHITKALIGAMLALALLPATQSEAQTQPHILPVTAASGNVAATPAVATLPEHTVFVVRDPPR